MNGAHDMGGRIGFGPIDPEKNEPVFHAPWEKRVYGTACALGAFGLWNIDEDRHTCENRPPHEYITSSYYEIWLKMLEELLVTKGIVTPYELASGKNLGGKITSPMLREQGVSEALFAPASYHRETGASAALAEGQKIRVRNLMTTGHTRLPGYLRGMEGTVVFIHGCHVFPDSSASGKGEDPKWLYGIRFNASDLWGVATTDTIQADLWEPYLEPV